MNANLHRSAIVLFSLLLLLGCGKKLPTIADLNDTNIKRLHSAYSIYMTSNQYRGPKDEAALKAFCNNDNTAKVLLGRMEITPDKIDGIFTSERDGKPFVVRYGLNGIADHAIVFEAEGLEGKRLVAFSAPRELETAEYDGYFSGKLKPEAPGAGELDIEPDMAPVDAK